MPKPSASSIARIGKYACSGMWLLGVATVPIESLNPVARLLRAHMVKSELVAPDLIGRVAGVRIGGGKKGGGGKEGGSVSVTLFRRRCE